MSGVENLLELMAKLRDPEKGCAWDLAQTPQSIVPYTIEEAYEVADAIDRGDMNDLRNELGDLLLQVVFQAQMAEEKDFFDFSDVVESIIAKLIRRHPHIFDKNGELLPSSLRTTHIADIDAEWDRIKRLEQESKSGTRKNISAIERIGSSVPSNLPALLRATKISSNAARYGFDWTSTGAVVEKIREEILEVEEAIQQGDSQEVAEEIGDLLFAVVNLSRHVAVNPEEALRQGICKFERRFDAVTDNLRSRGIKLEPHNLEHMEAAWQTIKSMEKTSS